ncbi:MAG: ZIP family metal transporter [Candidatus Paceibacterota bacterium]
MIEILIASLAIMLASLSGVLFVWKGVGKAIARNLHYLVSFSAGVFLIVSYQLGREVLHLSADTFVGAGWILLGAAGFWLIFALLPDFHHHHDDEREEHTHSPLDARRIMTGDAIHNVGDGVLIATAFVVNPGLGIITTISVFVHELVQEISEFFVLKQAGYSTKKALLINFLISSTILIGAVGSTLLLGVFSSLQLPLMGIAAGAFLVVVFQDLIPHSVREAKAEASHLKHVSWFAIGVILMFGVNAIAAHGHGDDEPRDDHHEHGEIHQQDEHHEVHQEHEAEHLDDTTEPYSN